MRGEHELLARVGVAAGQEVGYQAHGEHRVHAAVELVDHVHLRASAAAGPGDVEQHGQKAHETLRAGGLHAQREHVLAAVGTHVHGAQALHLGLAAPRSHGEHLEAVVARLDVENDGDDLVLSELGYAAAKRRVPRQRLGTHGLGDQARYTGVEPRQGLAREIQEALLGAGGRGERPRLRADAHQLERVRKPAVGLLELRDVLGNGALQEQPVASRALRRVAHVAGVGEEALAEEVLIGAAALGDAALVHERLPLLAHQLEGLEHDGVGSGLDVEAVDV